MNHKASLKTEVDEQLLRQAASLNIDVCSTIESALISAIKAKEKQQWFQKNSKAIEQHNQLVNETGTFSESIGQLE